VPLRSHGDKVSIVAVLLCTAAVIYTIKKINAVTKTRSYALMFLAPTLNEFTDTSERIVSPVGLQKEVIPGLF
jgi:hypothetical protein